MKTEPDADFIRRVSGPGNRDWIPSDPLPTDGSVITGDIVPGTAIGYTTDVICLRLFNSQFNVV